MEEGKARMCEVSRGSRKSSGDCSNPALRIVRSVWKVMGDEVLKAD